jgi:4-amino-4-deoxy-L-arabinose transferase-like glycosyltransferase
MNTSPPGHGVAEGDSKQARDPKVTIPETGRPNLTAELPPHTRKRLLRLASLVGGLALMGFGLALFRAEAPTRPPLVESINTHFRLDFNNLGNILQGIASLAVGTFLVARSFPSPEWLKGKVGDDDTSLFESRSLLRSRVWLIVGLIATVLVTIQLAVSGFQTQLIFLWLAGISLTGVAMYRWDVHRGVRPTTPLTKKDGYLILGLTFLALLIFTYRLEDTPSVLIGDEAAFFQHAHDLLTREGEFNPFGFATYSFPALGTYGQAFFLWVFGPSLWSWRLASAAFAALAVPGIYLLGMVVFERRIAITACLLYATLPFTLSFGRLGYNSAQVVPVVVLGTAFYLLGARQRSASWLFLGGVVAGLGFLTYTAGRILATTVLAYFVYRMYLAVRERSPLRIHLITLLIFSVATGVVTAPHLTYGLRAETTGLVWKLGESTLTNQLYVRDFFPNEFAFTVPTTTNALGHNQITDIGLTLRLIVRGTFRSALAFFLGGFFQQHFLVGPLAGEIGAVFILPGLVAFFGKIRRPPVLFLLVWFFLAFFLLSALNTYPPRPTHLIGMLPLIPLLVAIGLALTVDALETSLPRIGGTGNRLVLIAAIVALAASGLHAYFVTMPREYTPDIESAISWAGLANPDRLIVYAHTDPERTRFIPFIFLKMAPEVRFENVFISEDSGDLSHLPLAEEVELYVQEQDFALVRDDARRLWGTDLMLTTIADPQGHPRIRVLTNGTFQVGKSGNVLAHLWQSYILSPFKWIALGFALVAVLLRTGLPPLGSLRERLLHALIWVTEPPKKPG